jgi:hypothetical protein
MPEFLTDGDEIEFQPGAGWQWAPTFDGVVAGRANAERPMSVLSRQVLVGADLEQLAHQLEGKEYTTDRHTNPGKVATAVVVVDPTTLASPCQLLGEVPAVRATQGTFQVKCLPPASAPSGDIDNLPVKSGTWKIRSVQQSLARSGC